MGSFVSLIGTFEITKTMFTNKKYLYTTASNNYYREYELNINKIKFMKFFTNKISLLPHAHLKYAHMYFSH